MEFNGKNRVRTRYVDLKINRIKMRVETKTKERSVEEGEERPGTDIGRCHTANSRKEKEATKKIKNKPGE